MALSIATNVAALQSSASASSVNRDLETSMARLSTGKRINSASDDAAGVAIASRLTAEIRGTDQAIRNALDGQALIDTAEGGHKEIEAILQRMREVSIQGASDTNNAQDRGNLQAELKALNTEIDRIAGVTTWAGNSVMDGGGGATKTFSLQVGAATGTKNQINVSINSMSSASLGVKTTPVEGTHAVHDDAGGAKVTILSATGKANSDITFTVAGHDKDGNSISEVITGTDGATTATGTIDFQSVSSVTSSAAVEGAVKVGFAVGSSAAADDNAIGSYADTNTGALTIDGDEANTAYTPPVGSLTLVGAIGSKSAAVMSREAVTAIDAAIKTVNTQRSELGAISNRLSHTVSNMTNISTNLSAARGGIEDADFALETTNLAKNQILQQASTAMLAQANASKQNVLSLLQ